MFEEILKNVVDDTPGALAALLMGYDGIPVAQFVASDDMTMDVETIGMEFSVVLKGVLNAAEMLEVGKALEVSIKAERLTTLIRLVTSEYFMAVAIRPEGNLGKARYLARRSAPTLAESLS